ncbi:hypothetical protein SAMN05216593_104164 [Pseudomonas asturiensis]|uniref:Lipoprotein n=1 Tax=Pseudomonas asturiensis TaxID=1190415 RepID=A0A1M7MFT3_9PSED|nr:hypothetical protein [Pseudomonas asturiensis]SHM89242.1 hypothetical protein SAMN05216593_104164 [Pseudomonas asturiensis]
MNGKLAIVIAMGLLAGCSDPKKASEENFEKAAQAYLDTQYPKCFVLAAFPVASKEFDVSGQNKTFHALAGAGVLKETELSRKEIPKSVFSEARTDVRYSYDLTDEGRKYYKDNVQKLMNGNTVGGICVGKAKVVKIDQFSEPGEMMGQKISRVTYSYQINDLPGWARDPNVVASSEALKAAVDSEKLPIKETRAMVLTNNGWVHERLFGK